MADQPAQTPASDPDKPAQSPAPSSDDNKPSDPPAASSVTLTDEQKTYLKGQGLTDAELASPDAISKIITHAQASQQQMGKTQAELDAIRKAANPEKDPPADPFATPPTQPPEGSQPPKPSDDKPAAKGLDRLTAYNLAQNLGTSFPDLKEDLTSGKFYQDMQAMGIPTRLASGEVNLDGILKFGEFETNRRKAEAKANEEGKPGEGAIPDANPVTGAKPPVAEDAPMTKQMAQAIIVQDKGHKRFDEAKQFLESGGKPATK